MNRLERDNWLQNLLVDEVTQGLCGPQKAELDHLLLEDGTAVEERDSMLRAASAAEFAFAVSNRRAANDASSPGPLPEALERSLEHLVARAAGGKLSGQSEQGAEAESSALSGDPTRSVLSFPDSAQSQDDEPAEAAGGQAEPKRGGSSSSVAWWLAAAAAVLAVFGWVPRMVSPTPTPIVAEQSPSTKEAGAVDPLPSTEPADYATVLAMAGTEDAAGAGASGQLLWDGERQQGVMLIRGLAENDRALSQYQLWIFDAQRDERHPIDGGVFDISRSATRLADGTLVIPIDARLSVFEPTLFAITVEEPGGVVVSERERIVMVAAQA